MVRIDNLSQQSCSVVAFFPNDFTFQVMSSRSANQFFIENYGKKLFPCYKADVSQEKFKKHSLQVRVGKGEFYEKEIELQGIGVLKVFNPNQKEMVFNLEIYVDEKVVLM